MFSSLKSIAHVLDVVGVVSVVALIRLGFHLYHLAAPNTKDILISYFLYLCLVPVVIFIVSILLKKIINELGNESIAFNRRISDLENKAAK